MSSINEKSKETTDRQRQENADDDKHSNFRVLPVFDDLNDAQSVVQKSSDENLK